jgi:Xaa-Pro dipeptidase
LGGEGAYNTGSYRLVGSDITESSLAGCSLCGCYYRYDVDSVYLNEELFDHLDQWKEDNPDSTFFILHKDHRPVDKPFANVDSEKLKHAINVCRVIKDHHEIECIRRANQISASAHRAVLTNIRHFKNEAQIRGIFEDVCISREAKQAYSVIAGSGENAGELHYVKNNEPLKGRQLVCLDAGAEYQCYASDVTRTFPISGSWPSEEARCIYSLVKLMQETCIRLLKPGAKLFDLHVLCHVIAVDGLLKLGILHNGTRKEILKAGTSRAFYPHGLGHHVGLDVHDVNDIPAMTHAQRDHPLLDIATARAPCLLDQPPLEEGMVITIEPGIYFNRYELHRAYLDSPVHSKFINQDVLERYYAVGGVRIEDDVLITSRGYENLTTAPKGEEALEIIRNGSRSCNELESNETLQGIA